jgi:glycosylphosphatidylinositol transamidase (GPIT) subunit GPI8
MYVIIEFDPDKKTARLVSKDVFSARVFDSCDKAYEYVCDNIGLPYKIVSLGTDC